MKTRSTLSLPLCVCAAASLGGTALAHGAAQDPAPARAAANSSESTDDPRRSLEEVIVTAQRRVERLQDVPISISVLSGAELDQSTAQGVAQMLGRVPGVAISVAAQAGGALVAMRGVTAPSGFNTGSSPIGYYLDSVPFGFVRMAIVPDADVYDLDRIEVLRGPQGTLYGAGSQNGVVRVLTRDANLTDFELKAHTTYSRTDQGGNNVGADAAINVPLIEGKLAARAVVGYEDLDGWIDKSTRADANDARLRNARLKINAQPTDELSIGLSAWVSRSDFGSPSTSLDNHTNGNADIEQMEHEFDSFGLRVGYDFQSFSAVSTTSYLEYLNDGNQDLTLVGLPNVAQRTKLRPRTFAQELNFSSTGEGSWRWTAGGIYRDGSDRLFVTRTNLLLPQSILFTSESWAAFGELTRVLLDGRFEITAGLRHFEDDVTTQEEARLANVAPAAFIRTERSFDATTPRVVLTWLPSEQATFYASYSEGFRSGFDQLPSVLAAAPSLRPVEPDLLRNFEIGAKGALWDGRVSYDGAVYYMDWEDVQLPLLVLVDGVNRAAAVNGPSASGVGADLGLNARIGEHLELGITGSWNDLTVDTDVLSGGVLLFREGERLNMSPEYTVGASIDYGFPVGGSGLQGRFSLSGNLTSRLNNIALAGATRVIRRGDVIGLNQASFSIDSPRHWSAAVFVENLNNEDGAVVRSGSPVFDPRVRPRTVGVQLQYRF